MEAIVSLFYFILALGVNFNLASSNVIFGRRDVKFWRSDVTL